MSIAQPKYKDIDDYINSFPQATQEILQNLRETILQAIPELKETIRYDMPTFQLGDRSLVHFCAFKNHIGFYGISPDSGPFKKDLAKYFYPKSTIRFQINEPIPYDLVKRIVEYEATQESNNKY